MNRLKKLLAGLLLTALLLSLGGCLPLERLEAQCGNWTDDTHTAIRYNDATYVLARDLDTDVSGLWRVKTLFISEADVPLLLVSSFGTWTMGLGWDDNLICHAFYDYRSDGSYGSRLQLFCREDRLEEFNASFSLDLNPTPVRFYIGSLDCDGGTDVCTEELNALMRRTLAQAPLTEAEYAAVLDACEDYGGDTYVDAMDEFSLFGTSMRLTKLDGLYYLQADSPSETDADGYALQVYYPVPADESALLDEAIVF